LQIADNSVQNSILVVDLQRSGHTNVQ